MTLFVERILWVFALTPQGTMGMSDYSVENGLFDSPGMAGMDHSSDMNGMDHTMNSPEMNHESPSGKMGSRMAGG